MVLSVAGADRRSGANVQQLPWNNGPNQRWRGRGPNNNFELVSANSGKCLNVAGGTANNSNIDQSDCTGRPNQRWYMGYTQ